MNKPNIFTYATSELSQDAVICYILEWAKIENKELNNDLHNLAINFLNSLFDKFEGIKRPREYENIEIDFEGVNTFTPSWGDEFLTPLQNKYQKRLFLRASANRLGRSARFLQPISPPDEALLLVEFSFARFAKSAPFSMSISNELALF